MLMKRTLFVSSLMTISFLLAALGVLYGDRWFQQETVSDTIEIALVEVDESPVVLRMSVRESGIVAIAELDVERAGLPFNDFSAESLAISHNGESVPFYIDSREEENETLYFYAEALTDTLSAPAVYLLKSEEGAPMRVRDAMPTGPGVETGARSQRWEENSAFLASAHEIDPWLGALIFAPNSIDIPLSGIAPADGSAELTARLWSNNQATADPDHHIQFDLNGVEIADEFWDGITSVTINAAVRSGVLQTGNNILRLNAPGDTGAAGEAIYVDWIELAYTGELVMRGAPLRFRSNADNLRVRGATTTSLVFDISNPLEPTLLNNLQTDESGISFASEGLESEYLVLEPSQSVKPELTVAPLWDTPLRNESGADYVAILPTGNEFAISLQPLIELRKSQGLDTMTVQADQIYDEFGFGRKSPEAIRDFLAFARRNWSPVPSFVLLVGDASYDVNQLTEGANRDLLPTHHAFSGFGSIYANDSWFVDDGDPETVDAAIGRFPVQTVDQLRTIVRKTVAYDSVENPSWRSRTLLVADDEFYFDAASEELADSLDTSGFTNQKLYMSQNENIHDAIVGAINQGVGLLNYIGHGGVRVWGDERVFSVEDASTLINRTRLPVFTTFTCLNGLFNHPQDTGLAESLLWSEGGGAVAAIAPSGRSLISQQTQLSDIFFTQFLSDSTASLGEVLQTTKLRSNTSPALFEASKTFNLLGDPALRFELPSIPTSSQ